MADETKEKDKGAAWSNFTIGDDSDALKRFLLDEGDKFVEMFKRVIEKSGKKAGGKIKKSKIRGSGIAKKGVRPAKMR